MTEQKDSNPFLDALPPAVRDAILARDNQSLEQALLQMPRDEAEALARWLVLGGVLEKASPEQRAVPQPRPQTPTPAPSRICPRKNGCRLCRSSCGTCCTRRRG